MINKKCKHLLVALVLLQIIVFLPSTSLAKENTATFRNWVLKMKQAPRGPFSGIRWFCKDGSIMPAKPYTCGEHGGGVQHGLWNNKTKKIRAAGYKIANVFAGIKPDRFYASRRWRDDLGQVLIERFLIGFNDGWVFRSARFYRGALQVEDEAQGARKLLTGLLHKVDRESRRKQTSRINPTRINQDYLLIREAYRLLPRQQKSTSVNTVRNLASMIDERDRKFLPIRTKIHNQPDLSDARRVREHARKAGIPSLKNDYQKLARAIEKVYRPANTAEQVTRFARSLGKGDLKTALLKAVPSFAAGSSDQVRMLQAAYLLRLLRESYPRFRTDFTRLGTLKLSQQLEQEVFTKANRLANKAHRASRAQRLKWLEALGAAVYGSGLISQREWMAFDRSINKLSKPDIPLASYRNELRYLNRVPGWANHWLKFHFGGAILKMSRIEHLANHFIPDRLRGSAVLAYGKILDGLLKDANKLSGVHHQLFGKPIGAGIRSLNPGLARGVLHLPEEGSVRAEKKSIVLLPETTAELPPVAGILTMGEGNALSHVQLLAGNLGIPNVVIAENLQPLLDPMKNKIVVMAVSPGGVVQLDADSQKWHEYFSRQITPDDEGTISPDLDKLDLKQHRLISLADLRASDAGRITGPKAANLGELKTYFPDAVTSGLVVPFGVFREFLEQPYQSQDQGSGSSVSVFDWMQSEYRRIRKLDKPQRPEATKQLLKTLRLWIVNTSPKAAFRNQLAKRMKKIFGKDHSYAVFVRSDTNVEDLPGFTGAGLNLTVPNVKGLSHVIKAIQRVWASPFSERAFAWRQQRMTNPEQVYPSVLLLKSVAVDKSGVMITLDTETGNRNALTVAVNNGIGGAVQGQSAEELLIDPESGDVRLLADATAAKQRVLGKGGGLLKKQLAADGRVLTDSDIKILIRFAAKLQKKFPQHNDTGSVSPADVEFGFKDDKLVLFQVRPYLQNRRVKKNHYLVTLDQGLMQDPNKRINMNEVPDS